MSKQTLAVMPQLRATQEDKRAGVIVTAVHDDGPPLWSFHIDGPPEAALRSACARLDAAGEGWKVQTISTPRGVYRDLQGTRADHTVRDSHHNRSGASMERNGDNRPEVAQLGRIGRLDLLAPKRDVWA